MNFVVKPVESRRERKQFLEFPWEHYRGDPNWIPPLRMSQKQLVGYKRHPFQELSETQTFLALREGKPCGRIAAILNHAHNEYYHEKRGFFGFFESVDDAQVAHGLFDAVRDWLAKRDVHMMRGPANPSLNYECGLLVDGFHSPPTFLMTYNPPYYPRLVESYGFVKSQDLFAFLGETVNVNKLDKKLMFIANESQERFQITLRPLNKSRFREEIGMYLDIYNQSFLGMWGFVPMSKHEIEHLSAELKMMLVPELTCIASVDGKPIAAVFAIPDYNPRIKEIDGRLFPFGFLKLINKKRPFHRVRVVSTNVLPEFQRWGVGVVLLKGLVPRILSSGVKEVEFSWVTESNTLSRRSLEKGGAPLDKTFRLYDYGPRSAP